ncbi:MAG: hypothetical protein BA864_06375 [Desulfuromonadales bacterium C00003093]|nr:MAG: hypothetical protein BA864_06375 [Desulfuromonadales bacterium C00003093]
MRFFNTAGPTDCKKHYCIPPLERLNLEGILSLIDQEKYFVLHAPRQTGKTTCLLALMDYLNRERNYRCLYFNVEVGQFAREDVKQGMKAILNEMASMARTSLEDLFPKDIWRDVFEQSGEGGALNEVLTLWSQQSPKPLVLLIDEIDSLVGDTLISVLRQLRAGYTKRPAFFPQSIVLCGVRDVRDYRIHSDRDKAVITGGSAFNIKAKSLRLGDFSQKEIELLYRQHAEETGQTISVDALDLIWELTKGQPWLTNALGYEVCFEMQEGQDRSKAITPEMIAQAKENIILRRETHIDQLIDKLQEERVRRVIEPILSGKGRPEQIPEDDILYVKDLGLINTLGELRIANKIYQEVIPRALTYSTQLTISQDSAWYMLENGCLDMDRLMEAFQQFFREHSGHWIERFQYKEAGPQLLLQAFLQRIVNRGGRIEREYALGRKRTDLLVILSYPGGVQKVVLELKILYGALESTLEKGLEQTWEYMDHCGADQGHLVIFDRDSDKSWEKKIFRREEEYQGRKIMVWGM